MRIYHDDFLWFGEDKFIIEKIAKASKDGGVLWKKSTSMWKKVLGDWRVYHNVFDELNNICKHEYN